MTKIGVAYLCARLLTARRVDHVAKDYIAWIDGKDNESAAVDALLAAAQCSKNPTLVLAKADEYFADFSDGSVDESHDEEPETPQAPETPEAPAAAPAGESGQEPELSESPEAGSATEESTEA